MSENVMMLMIWRIIIMKIMNEDHHDDGKNMSGNYNVI